jgi:hypothetical protein
MDNIYDTLAKLNKVANRPEAKKIVKEDSNGMMRKGLKNLINKSSKMNKQSNYTPFSDKQSPDGLPEKKKDDKMFEAEATWPKSDDDESAPQVGDTVMHDKHGMLEVVKISDTDMMGEPAEYIVQTKGGKKRISYDRLVMGESVNEADLVEKESDVERDDRAEKAGREVAHDAKYDHRRHAGKDGKDVTGDIEYDEKHDKDGMHEASKTMVKGPDGKMVPDYAVDGKGKHDMKEGGSLKDAARAGVMARLAELAGLPAQEIEEALGDSPEDTASRIMSEVSLDEEDTNEGNAFSGALEDAKENGKSEFEVDGKKYKVEAIDSDEDAIQEADDDGMPSMTEMKSCVDKGMTEDEICEKYSDCDSKKIKLMASKCGKMNEGEDGDMPSKAHIEKMCKDGKTKEEICDMHPNCDQGELKKMIDDCSEHMTEGGGRDMDCATCDGTGKDADKECKSCEGSGEAQDDDDPMNNESKVEETTSAGSVADGAGSGSSPYKNASVYESNEIVKRARQLNEDMSFTVSGGPEQEPTLNINASGEEAMQLAQLLKLSGMGMTPAAPQYGEVEIQVAEDQEFANSNQNEETADTNTLVNTISGGLNGQKKMAYPRASQGDNAMATLGESELVATSANQLMKQYEAFKTK